MTGGVDLSQLQFRAQDLRVTQKQAEPEFASNLASMILPAPESIELEGSFEVTGAPVTVQALLNVLHALYHERVLRRFEVVLLRPHISIRTEWPYQAGRFESYRVSISASVQSGHSTMGPLVQALGSPTRALPSSSRF